MMPYEPGEGWNELGVGLEQLQEAANCQYPAYQKIHVPEARAILAHIAELEKELAEAKAENEQLKKKLDLMPDTICQQCGNIIQ